jgi:hypothetical protein
MSLEPPRDPSLDRLSDSPKDRFALILSAVFFALVVGQLWQHVMWRDEIRTWQICRESTSLASLSSAMRFDAVPVLWNWIVFALTRISGKPFTMQLAHALIATGVVYVVARWAPFPKWMKAAFAFGYYPFFEYAAITRTYSLIFLLMLATCALMSQAKVRVMVISIVLFLMTQTSVWGVGLAIVLLGAAIARAVSSPREIRPRAWAIGVSVLVVLCGAVLCWIEIRPGPDSSATDTWGSASATMRLLGSISTVYRAWFPIPRWSRNFWGTNVLEGMAAVQVVLSCALIIAAILMLLCRPIALGLFVAGIIELLAFAYRFKGVTRHNGHLFMLLIACCWLAATSPPWPGRHRVYAAATEWLERARQPFLAGILVVNAASGIIVAIAAMFLPFSSSLAVADYIQQHFDDRTILVAVDDFSAAPVSAWLDRSIYFPQMRRFARYNTQNAAERTAVNVATVLPEIHDLADTRHADVVLMLSSDRHLTDRDLLINLPPTPTDPAPKLRIRVLPSFTAGVVSEENQHLYLLSVVK